MAVEKCPVGFKAMTKRETATTLASLREFQESYEMNVENWGDFFDPKEGGAKALSENGIDDFAEKINTSLVCIKK